MESFSGPGKFTRHGFLCSASFLASMIVIAAGIACSGGPQPVDKNIKDLEYGKFTDFRSTIPEYKELFNLIRATLSHNQVTFQGKTGPISGFAAGSAYPQIWLRDANTIIPASRYFYEIPYLRSWLIEHLAVQKDDGSLEDWLDSRGKTDKNTTETDQETSAVQAGGQISRVLGEAWLEEKINGAAVLSRLEKAMLYVLDHRFDRQRGLVTGAHTADWGDVDMEHPDQNAIYADSRTHRTCDIYDQSMFYGAARSLAGMFDGRGMKDKSRSWEEKAGSIQRNTDRWLWQEDKGFYRVHIHLDSLRHDFDEDGMFAMGGNAEAILSGLASEEKCRRIIESALARQKAFSISTIGGTLLPPYPKKFFKHPMMDDSFEYQNGGQWDWFAGRIVYAMFEKGFSRQAREKLLEIAKKDVANRGLYEWDSPDGTGRGSAFYSGSAGSLAKALFEGYFGLKISKESLELEPKLGPDSAVVHVYIPASDLFAAYAYQYDGQTGNIVLRYNSNFSGRGKIKVLMPDPGPGRISDNKNDRLSVRRDGARIPFVQSESGEDRFITIETDFQNHILEIKR
ncbi:MAG: hypothetical protein NTV82_08775 [Candidatus Aminicenantes bacterium]|nr:hypothetical protein [Candidatus Aminicenantes bacterium]